MNFKEKAEEIAARYYSYIDVLPSTKNQAFHDLVKSITEALSDAHTTGYREAVVATDPDTRSARVSSEPVNSIFDERVKPFLVDDTTSFDEAWTRWISACFGDTYWEHETYKRIPEDLWQTAYRAGSIFGFNKAQSLALQAHRAGGETMSHDTKAFLLILPIIIPPFIVMCFALNAVIKFIDRFRK